MTKQTELEIEAEKIRKAKDYLGQYQFSLYRVKELKLRQQDLANSTNGCVLKLPENTNNKENFKMNKFLDLADEIERKISESSQMLIRIDDEINTLTDCVHKQVLLEVYCHNKQVKELNISNKSNTKYLYTILNEAALNFYNTILAERI